MRPVQRGMSWAFPGTARGNGVVCRTFVGCTMTRGFLENGLQF